MLSESDLSAIASAHVRVHYPEGYVAKCVLLVTDPPGAYFFGRWGGPPDPPGSRDHVLFGPGGFFVSAVDGALTIYGSGEYMEAYAASGHSRDDGAVARAILRERPPN